MEKMRKLNRDRKYDELEEGSSSVAKETGRRKPVYLDYDAAGRKKEIDGHEEINI